MSTRRSRSAWKRRRDGRDRRFQARGIELGDERRLGGLGAHAGDRHLRAGGRVDVVDQHQRMRAVLAHPAVGAVAHDGEEPGARIAAGEPENGAERLQAGVLDHVVGVRDVAGEEARKRMRVVEVRQHDAVKARRLFAGMRLRSTVDKVRPLALRALPIALAIRTSNSDIVEDHGPSVPA